MDSKFCCIEKCRSNFKNLCKLSSFKFPNDVELTNKWLTAIEQTDFVPDEKTTLCELHFKPEAMYKLIRTNGSHKTVLSSNAIPSLLLNPKSILNENEYQHEIKKKRNFRSLIKKEIFFASKEIHKPLAKNENEGSDKSFTYISTVDLKKNVEKVAEKFAEKPQPSFIQDMLKRQIENSDQLNRCVNTFCILCHCDIQDELNYGPFVRLESGAFHYNCMLFSDWDRHKQLINDKGVVDFSPDLVYREAARGLTNKCSYCLEYGATIPCCVYNCSTVFHMNCGILSHSMHQFTWKFRSYCLLHRPYQTKKSSNYNSIEECIYCFGLVNATDPFTSMSCPCCPNTWFHRQCMQRSAKKAGKGLKCPACNNMKLFSQEMLQLGIDIPQMESCSGDKIPITCDISSEFNKGVKRSLDGTDFFIEFEVKSGKRMKISVKEWAQLLKPSHTFYDLYNDIDDEEGDDLSSKVEHPKILDFISLKGIDCVAEAEKLISDSNEIPSTSHIDNSESSSSLDTNCYSPSSSSSLDLNTTSVNIKNKPQLCDVVVTAQLKENRPDNISKESYTDNPKATSIDNTVPIKAEEELVDHHNYALKPDLTSPTKEVLKCHDYALQQVHFKVVVASNAEWTKEKSMRCEICRFDNSTENDDLIIETSDRTNEIANEVLIEENILFDSIPKVENDGDSITEFVAITDESDSSTPFEIELNMLSNALIYKEETKSLPPDDENQELEETTDSIESTQGPKEELGLLDISEKTKNQYKFRNSALILHWLIYCLDNKCYEQLQWIPNRSGYFTVPWPRMNTLTIGNSWHMFIDYAVLKGEARKLSAELLIRAKRNFRAAMNKYLIRSVKCGILGTTVRVYYLNDLEVHRKEMAIRKYDYSVYIPKSGMVKLGIMNS